MLKKNQFRFDLDERRVGRKCAIYYENGTFSFHVHSSRSRVDLIGRASELFRNTVNVGCTRYVSACSTIVDCGGWKQTVRDIYRLGSLEDALRS